MTPAGSLTLRLAGEGDACELRDLAGRDSARELTGTVLAAELDGAILAAASLEEERVIADPFRPTAEVVELLRLRLSHLRGTARGGGATSRSRPARAVRDDRSAARAARPSRAVA